MTATKKESSTIAPTAPGKPGTLWALLCLVVAFLLAGTRAEAFFAQPDLAPGILAPAAPESTGQNYDGSQYDALDSLIAAKGIATPYGAALQSEAAAAAAARAQVSGGSTLYRVGTTGRSAAGEAQFWALEHPSSPGFASRYGLPAENVAAADFIETATLKPGTPFITRPAPGIGTNPGGGIEVVVPSGGVRLDSFHYGPNILGH